MKQETKQRAYPKVVMEITMLTPEKAKSLLDTQTGEQRQLSQPYVARYIDAMKRGLWRFDATPIKLDWDGRLLDGQHRCRMVVKTGKAVKMLMVYGLDPEVFKVLDSGKRRTLGDAFRNQGESHANTLAAGISLLYLHELDAFLTGKSRGFLVPQTEVAVKLLEKNPNLRASLDKVYSARSALPESVGCFLHYVFSQKDKSKADAFFEKLATGEGFKEKDPIRVLRDKLLFNKTQAIKMQRYYKMAITIKAWNVFRRDGTLGKLTWRGSKLMRKEPMPIIE